MVYLIYGKDTYRSRQKLRDLLAFFRGKVSDLGIFGVSNEDFDQVQLEELLKSQSLFEKKYVVVCEELLKDKKASEFVKDNIENLKESKNIFLFWEEEVEKEDLKLFEEYSEKNQQFNPITGAKLKKWIQVEAKKLEKELSSVEQDEVVTRCGSDLWCASREIEKFALGAESEQRGGVLKYNPFHICDAVSAKDGNKAWAVLQQAILMGVSSEEVFWKVWWQMKNLILVKKLHQAGVQNIEKKSGLHPFVVKKTLNSAKNFTETELHEISFDLVRLYHESRRGLQDFPIGLEKILLKL